MARYVVARRHAGESHGTALAAGTRVIDFRHDGDGGKVVLYGFADHDTARNFAATVRGEVLASEAHARSAFEELSDGGA